MSLWSRHEVLNTTLVFLLRCSTCLQAAVVLSRMIEKPAWIAALTNTNNTDRLTTHAHHQTWGLAKRFVSLCVAATAQPSAGPVIAPAWYLMACLPLKKSTMIYNDSWNVKYIGYYMNRKKSKNFESLMVSRAALGGREFQPTNYCLSEGWPLLFHLFSTSSWMSLHIWAWK